VEASDMSQDQYDQRDPTKQYPRPTFPEQEQEHPGFTDDMRPRPDHGEKTYRGSARLTDRRAIITGGDSGIGRAVAIAFAREGADVLISYLSEEEKDAQETAALVKDAGRTVLTMPGDIRDEGFCRQIIERAVSEMGGIDILVNNAAYQMAVDDLESLTTEQLDRTFRTNVYAMYWLCKAALPHLQAGSVIINTTSIQAYEPSPGLIDYAATKAAIVNFTKALGQALGSKGIRVNAVAPGPIWTPLIPATTGSEKPAEFGKNTPLGRAGQPAEVAPAYVFLASQESSYITAEVIGVTGGRPLS
jgi:NAD(P)-dependent dehydrogenase (short-subunit alcohol dehydrogenase family)